LSQMWMNMIWKTSSSGADHLIKNRYAVLIPGIPVF
jgi:hypothetical protein